MFRAILYIFYQDLLFGRNPFYFQFNANENNLRAFSTIRSVRLRVRFESRSMIKAEVAGFVQCLMRSCIQRRILLIMLLQGNYLIRVKQHDNPFLPLKT